MPDHSMQPRLPAHPAFTLVKRFPWFSLPARSPQAMALGVAGWIALVGNLALWHELWVIGGTAASIGVPTGALIVMLLTGTLALLAATAWPHVMKPIWMGLLLVTAVAQYYMLQYHMVIDTTMLHNVLQTDLHEARDLLSASLAAHVLVVAGLPSLWLACTPVRCATALRHSLRNALVIIVALIVLASVVAATYRQVAPLMRNQMHLRFMLNPLASVYAALAAGIKPLIQHKPGLAKHSAGSVLGASYAAQEKPPLLVLVVGETARADHFGLNGYDRDTTPELSAHAVLSFRDVHSCGTNTLASVPCMFSPLGKAGYEQRSMEHENLLDVLQAAGLAVLWVDNQSGCKGVCDRVPHGSTGELAASLQSTLCTEKAECLDEALLQGLDQRIADLPAERRNKGVVVVLHQMGSHGPAYYRRSTPSTKLFMPECRTHQLADCAPDALINAYDNSIRYTDHFLAQTIHWLQAREQQWQPALLYISDHGESLGEYGLYLHGVPYAFAPDVQKHVPWVMWFGPGFAARRQINRQCLDDKQAVSLSHDHLYHSVLGLMDVHNSTYLSAMDALASCTKRG